MSLFGSNGKGLSQSDIDAITQYNNQLKQGVTSQTAWNRTMLQASPAAQQMVSSANGAAVAVENLGTNAELTRWQMLKLRAASLALNVAFSVISMLIVRGVVKAFTHLYNIQDKLAEKNKELTSSLKSQTDEYNNLKSELDEVNKKLKDNESRYSELIEKQKESGLTTEESGELEELQRITGELTNQKNILEENISLKKESAASTAQELANTLLKQEDVKTFMDGAGGKIKSFFNEIQESSIKMIPGFGKLYSAIDTVISLFNIEMPKDSWLNKIVNIFDGTAIISWLTGTDIEEDSYDEAVSKYEDLQKKMKTIRDKYDKNGDGIIDSDSSMSSEDSETYKKYYDESVEVANNLKTEYQELDDAIKAIEADPNLTQVNKEELEKLRATRDIIAEILGYNNEGKTGDGIISDEDVKNADDVTVLLETFNKEMDAIQSSYDAVKSAIDEYNEQGYLSVDTTQKLLELDDELLATMVDENGQVNLNTTSFEDLARAKLENLKASAVDALNTWITKLQEEGTTADELAAKYEKVGLAKNLANGEVSTGYEDREGNWVDVTNTPEYKAYLARKKAIDDAIAGIGKGGLGSGGNKNKNDLAKEHLEKARDYAEKVSEIQEDLAEKEKDFAENMADAWKEERLEQLKDGLEKQKDLIDRYNKNIEVTDFGLEHIEADDFSNRADLLSDKLDQLKSYGTAMREEFDRIANIIPQTGDEAVELANRIEELGSEMRDNVSAIRETTVEMQKLSIDMASTLIGDRMGELKSELDNIDKRINILNSEYKDDYQSVNDVLSIDMLLPVYSEFDKKRRDKQRADKALIDTEQETQDKINEIVTKSLEMQAQQNAEAREKERQKLIEDMEKARKDAKKKLVEAHQDYLDFLTDNKLATSGAVQEISDMFANANLKLPEVDITSVDSALNKIKQKMSEIFTLPSTEKSETGFINPTKGTITSPFGYRKSVPTTNGQWSSSNHQGIDIAGALGDPIVAIGDGTVVSSGWITGYGNSIKIQHGNGFESQYNHMQFQSPYKKGDKVSQGDIIGLQGDTGNVTGVHLDFQIFKDGVAQNPENYIPGGYARKYAKGTPGGNRLAHRLGIAGENFKPEILIDKATGERTYIDKPTVIDTTKTDVVGEKATAILPKFATGTPMADEKYLKEIKAACDVFNIPYAIALSMIDNESANGTAYDTWMKNSAGAVGLTQVTESALGDFRETWHSVSKDIVAKLTENGVNFENSRTTDESAYRDNIWTGIANLRLINDRYFNGSDNTWAKTLGWYYAGGNYNGSDGTWYANQLINLANTQAFKDAAEALSNASDTLTDKVVEPLADTSNSESANDKSTIWIGQIEGKYNEALDAIARIEKDIILAEQNILNNKELSDFDKSQELYNLKYEKGLEASAAGKEIYNQVAESFKAWSQAVNDGTEIWSLETYTAFKDALTDIIDLTYDMANSAVEDKQTGANERWALSENWIADRDFYNDWELFDDSEVEAWERVIKWLNKDYPKELEKIKQAEQKLFSARKAEAEKSISDIEEYISARNHYNDWDAYHDSEVKAIKRITKIIEDEYKQRLISYDEYVSKIEEQSQKIYSLAQNEIDKNLSNVDKYISARNHFNDWDEFGDSEIDAINRQIQYLDAAYEHNLMSYEDYTERVAEYTQKLYSVAKDSITEEVSKLIEDYEEAKNLESSQLDSQKTLLQSYYDVSNAVAEARHEINKELEASKTMYEYLNEGTRKLLFNQGDYNALNRELLEIQAAADDLQKQYQEDILNANAETIAEITSQYQMQYETMMKQYEIAKAELEVAKKRQQLDNVLAERNTRMFINGQWQWVAKTQDVINAQNELADAEINRKKQESTLEQAEAINEFTEQINALNTDLKKIRKYWSDMQEMLNGESDEVAKALKQISEVSSPELQRVIKATGGSVDSFSDSMSINTQTMSTVINENLTGVSLGVSGFISNLGTYSDAIKSLADKISGAKSSSSSSSTSDAAIRAQMAANSAAWHTASTQAEKDRLHDENVRLGELIGLGEDDYDDVTGKWKYHADGTRYTPGGLTALGEKGFEAYITNNGRLIPIGQPTIGNISAGGIVFNREQMANLRTLWDLSNLGKVTSFVSSSNMNKQNTTIDNSIHINGITVSEQGNEDWINGLRRYVATHK